MIRQPDGDLLSGRFRFCGAFRTHYAMSGPAVMPVPIRRKKCAPLRAWDDFREAADAPAEGAVPARAKVPDEQIGLLDRHLSKVAL